MYKKYWNLREAPFVNLYNPRQLYHSSQFEEGVARLFYLVSEGRVAGILTGQFGMGKSFLLSNLTERIAQAGIPHIRIDAIPKGHLALLRHVIAGLGVKGTVASIADGLMTLQELSRKPGALKHHAILIDEAQYLGDDDGLYLIHYLSNLRLTSSDGRELPTSPCAPGCSLPGRSNPSRTARPLSSSSTRSCRRAATCGYSTKRPCPSFTAFPAASREASPTSATPR